MLKKWLYPLLLLSLVFNLGFGILYYAMGDLTIKEQLMVDVMYTLIDKDITADDIKSFQVKHTLPHQSNVLDTYGIKDGWEIRIVFAHRPDEIQFYFYSEASGDQLDGLSISNERLKEMGFKFN